MFCIGMGIDEELQNDDITSVSELDSVHAGSPIFITQPRDIEAYCYEADIDSDMQYDSDTVVYEWKNDFLTWKPRLPDMKYLLTWTIIIYSVSNGFSTAFANLNLTIKWSQEFRVHTDVGANSILLFFYNSFE